MYGYGMHFKNEYMQQYVDFICSLIDKNGGAEVNSTDGFPMKGCYVPVQVTILEKTTRTAVIQIIALGYTREFIFYMSRHKGPASLLWQLQQSINENVNDIVNTTDLDRDTIFNKYHALKIKL